MNERILELATKAKEFATTKDAFGEYDVSFDQTKFEQKFAELIIAKCIEEAGEPADGLIKGDTWHDGVRASVWSIKQYFGITK